MATAVLKYDFSGIANRIRWSEGAIVTSCSATGQDHVSSSTVTITGTLPGHGRVNSISVIADGCPVSSSGYNGTQYSATVTISCSTFTVTETFTNMAAHNILTWPTTYSGTSDMLSASFWASLTLQTTDNFSLWADQSSSVTVTIDYTENPPVLTAPTQMINGSTSASTAQIATQSWSGGSVTGDGTSPTDLMTVDIYTAGGTNIGHTTCQINASDSYTLSSPSTYTTATNIYLLCSYSGTTAYSNTVSYTYTSATLSAPMDQMANGASSSAAQTCRLTWTASVCSDPSQSFDYKIYNGTTLLASGITTTEYTFSKAVCSQWTQPITLQVCGHLIAADMNSALSNSVTFTYRDSYTIGLYVNGSWQDYVIYYYDNGWQECVPYIYSNGWQECSTS